MKKNSLLILGILIGTFLNLFITVFASTLFNAKEISFSPNNSSWKVSTVADAINDLGKVKTYGTATSDNILSGKSALVQGNEIEGTMLDNSSSDISLTNMNITGDDVTFNLPLNGYYSTDTTIKASTSLLSMGTNSYSTTEKAVGTWIDGKTIYAKTEKLSITSSGATLNNFSTGISVNGTTATAVTYMTTFTKSSLGLDNMDSLINFNGHAIVDNGNTIVNFPTYLTANSAWLDAYYSVGSSYFRVYAGTQYSNASIYVTFYYTKK